MISLIVTAWEEPEEVRECLRRLTTQDYKGDYEILAIAPDEPTKNEILKYVEKDPQRIHFQVQPREKGKNEMLNILSKQAKGEILIFLDGDIWLSENAVSEIVEMYDDPKIGAVTGRVTSRNPKNTKLGFWSHLLVDAGAHLERKERFEKGEFLECSGYLYSIRNGVIGDIPMDVAEDSVMPLLMYRKGYKIGYAEKALASVSYPETWEKWKSQKLRCAKAHEKMDSYGGEEIKMKSFKNEVSKGTFRALSYPKTPQEYLWTAELFGARAYIWGHYFYDTKIKKSHYGERWTKIQGDAKAQGST